MIGAVAVGTVAVLGGGAFAAWWFLSGGGPQPEEALPASTIAVVSIDLDPSAGQKIEAIKALRKFPKFTDELDIDSRDDLRRFVFDKALGNDCKDLSYDDDVEPWIGERAALAAVDLGEDSPVPTILLAITDQDKAKAGIEDVLACADDEETGYALGEDFAVFSDTQKHAEAILADGKAKPLSEDDDYQEITDKVDDKGVVNFYVAKDTAGLIADELANYEDELTGEATGEGRISYEPTAHRGSSAPAASGCNPSDYYDEQLSAFTGLAGTVRFNDGGMELEAISPGANGEAVPVGKQVQELPADSALAFGASVPDESIDAGVDLMEACEEGMVSEIEDATGLDLPADLKTLLGSSFTLTVSEDFPDDLNDIDEPSDVPAGVVINGDADKITDLIDRLDRRLQESEGVSLDDIGVQVESSGDKVVLSPSESYADALAEKGALGEEKNFKDAVPDAARAASIFYLNFDSRIKDALLRLAADSGEDPDIIEEIRDNLEPLTSLGYSTWADGGEAHFLLKIATD